MGAKIDINFWAVKNGKQDFDGQEYIATVRGSREGIERVLLITDMAGEAVTKSQFKELSKDLRATMNDTVADNY